MLWTILPLRLPAVPLAQAAGLPVSPWTIPPAHGLFNWQTPATLPGNPVPPAAPPAPTPTPVVDRHLPSLTLDVLINPDPVTVGDAVTVTLVVANRAADPAQNLSLTLPLPSGAVAVPAAGGWSWTQATLAAHSAVTATAHLLLPQMPAGEALVLGV